ncbi:MAG: Nif3-like dinuclear metal center hexameric protein [Tenacibaculum sp.]
MQIKDITNCIEQLAPLSNAEDFDNVGLLVGSYTAQVTGVLITLDTLEATVDEAIAKNCNLIVSFHPIIFSGLKKITGSNYTERVVLKAIQNHIAIYATHTALDNVKAGVSAKMCEVLGLKHTKILIPKKGCIKKLNTYVPVNFANELRSELFKAGAGNIGNYSHCSFNTDGKGTFKGGENSKPTLGNKGELMCEDEVCIKVIFEDYLEKTVLQALFANHPYQEVAYELSTLNNSNPDIGMGMLGELSCDMSETDFIQMLKTKFKTTCIRHSVLLDKPIKKIAVLGGAGSFAINKAIKAKADAYVSADFKYHDFFKAENKLLLVDIGHYESEQYTKNILFDYLSEKFNTFAFILSETSTNPIYYM